VGALSPVRDKADGPAAEDRFIASVAGHDASAPTHTPDPGLGPEMDKEASGKAPKLSKSDETPATAGPCGQYSWGIKWALDKPSAKGGWIVQKVKKSRAEVLCGGATPDIHQFLFWEAWPVNKGQSVTAYAEKGDIRDDSYLSLKPANSTGTMSDTGEANFHEGIGDIAKYGFKVLHKPPAGDLPMTTTDPGLPAGTGAIPHSITATWDCCAKGKGASTKTNIVTE